MIKLREYEIDWLEWFIGFLEEEGENRILGVCYTQDTDLGFALEDLEDALIREILKSALEDQKNG